MNKRLNIFILAALIILVIGCEVKSVAKQPIIIPEPVVEQVKDTIPLDERKFIYNNALKYEQKDFNTIDKKNINVMNSYPVITGLKNKSVQDNINKEIEEVGQGLLSQYELKFLTMMQDDIVKINGKSSNAYISYSYNNVIFVEYSVYIEAEFKDEKYYPCYTNEFCGYDLNTGERIKLSDAFKPGSDYISKINNFISQYIIKNNYDDYEAERMTKPFQGIKDDQRFALGFEGLRIILDEKNDEFFYNGYADQILIPYSYFGDDLYIYDRYFDEGHNIFEQDKLIKKLIPNKFEFKLHRIIEETNPKYYIYIYEGEFINVPNKDIEKKLNELVVLKADIETFKKHALDSTDTKATSNLGHYVNVFTNAGGYLSVSVFDQLSFGEPNKFERTTFNYDFNKEKELLLSDLFIEGVDIEGIIKDYIRKMDYSVAEELIETGVKEAIKSKDFYFEEYGITIKFSPEGSKLDPYQEWIPIPFDEFGIENINILN
jgi:hypothetical protein